MRIALLFFFIALGIGAFAQKKKRPVNSQNAPEAFYPQEDLAPKSDGKKQNRVTYDAREKFYARQERNKKSREKNYSGADHSQAPYFGHKRIPEIRPVGKRKLCKICGMTH